MARVEAQLQELLKLPVDDRAHAAKRLLDSLDQDEHDPDADCRASASPHRAEVVPSPPISLGASSVVRPSSSVSQARRAMWAELLRRVYDVDALRCPRCGGELRGIAALTERSAVRELLAHLNLDDEPPPPASRPRGPPWMFEP